MKKIKLTQGKYAFVDDGDFEYLNQWKWRIHSSDRSKTEYAARWEYIGQKRKLLKIHVAIMGPGLWDHKDENGLNNTRKNLRKCCAIQNAQNRSKYKCNSTGFKGVTLDKRCRHKPFRADIKVSKKRVFLGNFSTAQEAGDAYIAAALKYHGEFAKW